MLFLMRGRNESAVYFEHELELAKTVPWIEGFNARTGARATVFHLVLHALASVLHERERLNRFTVGSRHYQRAAVQLSFAAKKAMADDAPLATIKRTFDRDESFAALVAALTADIGSARSERSSPMDRELKALLAMPGFVLGRSIGVLRRLYGWGLAPRSLVDTDPLYTSAFVANLGSLQIDAAYHHLYEHGNCPLFVTIGRIVDERVTLKYTFDERVEDGLYCARSLQLFKERVEDPAAWIRA